MLSNYRVKYSETEEVIQDVCRVAAAEKVAWNHRITVATVGLISIIVIMQKLGGSFAALPKYLVIWALAFVAAEILVPIHSAFFHRTSPESFAFPFSEPQDLPLSHFFRLWRFAPQFVLGIAADIPSVLFP